MKLKHIVYTLIILVLLSTLVPVFVTSEGAPKVSPAWEPVDCALHCKREVDASLCGNTPAGMLEPKCCDVMTCDTSGACTNSITTFKEDTLNDGGNCLGLLTEDSYDYVCPLGWRRDKLGDASCIEAGAPGVYGVDENFVGPLPNPENNALTSMCCCAPAENTCNGYSPDYIPDYNIGVRPEGDIQREAFLKDETIAWYATVRIKKTGFLDAANSKAYNIKHEELSDPYAFRNFVRYVKVKNDGTVECGEIRGSIPTFSESNCENTPGNRAKGTAINVYRIPPCALQGEEDFPKKYTTLMKIDRAEAGLPGQDVISDDWLHYVTVDGVWDVIGLYDGDVLRAQDSGAGGIQDVRKDIADTYDQTAGDAGGSGLKPPSEGYYDYIMTFILARSCDIPLAVDETRLCKDVRVEGYSIHKDYLSVVDEAGFTKCDWEMLDSGKYQDFPGVYITVLNKSRHGSNLGLKNYNVNALSLHSNLNIVNPSSLNIVREENIQGLLEWNQKAAGRLLGCRTDSNAFWSDTCGPGNLTCSYGAAMAAAYNDGFLNEGLDGGNGPIKNELSKKCGFLEWEQPKDSVFAGETADYFQFNDFDDEDKGGKPGSLYYSDVFREDNGDPERYDDRSFDFELGMPDREQLLKTSENSDYGSGGSGATCCPDNWYLCTQLFGDKQYCSKLPDLGCIHDDDWCLLPGEVCISGNDIDLGLEELGNCRKYEVKGIESIITHINATFIDEDSVVWKGIDYRKALPIPGGLSCKAGEDPSLKWFKIPWGPGYYEGGGGDDDADDGWINNPLIYGGTEFKYMKEKFVELDYDAYPAETKWPVSDDSWWKKVFNPAKWLIWNEEWLSKNTCNNPIVYYDERRYTSYQLPDYMGGGDGPAATDRYWIIAPGEDDDPTPDIFCTRPAHTPLYYSNPGGTEKPGDAPDVSPFSTSDDELAYYRQFNKDMLWVNIFKVTPEFHDKPPNDELCAVETEGNFGGLGVAQGDCDGECDIAEMEVCDKGLVCSEKTPEGVKFCCPPDQTKYINEHYRCCNKKSWELKFSEPSKECSDDSECPFRYGCLGDAVNNEDYCVMTCSNDANCPFGFSCLKEDINGRNYCVSVDDEVAECKSEGDCSKSNTACEETIDGKKLCFYFNPINSKCAECQEKSSEDGYMLTCQGDCNTDQMNGEKACSPNECSPGLQCNGRQDDFISDFCCPQGYVWDLGTQCCKQCGVFEANLYDGDYCSLKSHATSISYSAPSQGGTTCCPDNWYLCTELFSDKQYCSRYFGFACIREDKWCKLQGEVCVSGSIIQEGYEETGNCAKGEQCKCQEGEGGCSEKNSANECATGLKCVDNPYVNSWTNTNADNACCPDVPGVIWTGYECKPTNSIRHDAVIYTRTGGNSAGVGEKGGGAIWFHFAAGGNLPNETEAGGTYTSQEYCVEVLEKSASECARETPIGSFWTDDTCVNAWEYMRDQGGIWDEQKNLGFERVQEATIVETKFPKTVPPDASFCSVGELKQGYWCTEDDGCNCHTNEQAMSTLPGPWATKISAAGHSPTWLCDAAKEWDQGAEPAPPESCGSLCRKEVLKNKYRENQVYSWFNYTIVEYDKDGKKEITVGRTEGDMLGGQNVLPLETPWNFLNVGERLVEHSLKDDTQKFEMYLNYTAKHSLLRQPLAQTCNWDGCVMEQACDWEDLYDECDMDDDGTYETKTLVVRMDCDKAPCEGECGNRMYWTGTSWREYPSPFQKTIPGEGDDDDPTIINCQTQYKFKTCTRCWGAWEHRACNYPVSAEDPKDGYNEEKYEALEEIIDTSVVEAIPYGEHLETSRPLGDDDSHVEIKVSGYVDYKKKGDGIDARDSNVNGSLTVSAISKIDGSDLLGGIDLLVPDTFMIKVPIKSYPAIHDLYIIESTQERENVLVNKEMQELMHLDSCTANNNNYIHYVINPLKKYYYAAQGQITEDGQRAFYSAIGEKYTWDVTLYCKKGIFSRDTYKDELGMFRNFHEDESKYWDFVGFSPQLSDLATQEFTLTGGDPSASNILPFKADPADPSHIKSNLKYDQAKKEYTLYFSTQSIDSNVFDSAVLRIYSDFRYMEVHPFRTENPKPLSCIRDEIKETIGAVTKEIFMRHPVELEMETTEDETTVTLKIRVKDLCTGDYLDSGKVNIKFNYPYTKYSGEKDIETDIVLKKEGKYLGFLAEYGGEYSILPKKMYQPAIKFFSMNVKYVTFMDYVAENLPILAVVFLVLMSYRFFSEKRMDLMEMWEEWKGKR